MFQIDVYEETMADAKLGELAVAIDRYADLLGEKPSSVVTKLAGVVERLAAFEELRGRFDVRRQGS